MCMGQIYPFNVKGLNVPVGSLQSMGNSVLLSIAFTDFKLVDNINPDRVVAALRTGIASCTTESKLKLVLTIPDATHKTLKITVYISSFEKYEFVISMEEVECILLDLGYTRKVTWTRPTPLR